MAVSYTHNGENLNVMLESLLFQSTFEKTLIFVPGRCDFAFLKILSLTAQSCRTVPDLSELKKKDLLQLLVG